MSLRTFRVLFVRVTTCSDVDGDATLKIYLFSQVDLGLIHTQLMRKMINKNIVIN